MLIVVDGFGLSSIQDPWPWFYFGFRRTRSHHQSDCLGFCLKLISCVNLQLWGGSFQGHPTPKLGWMSKSGAAKRILRLVDNFWTPAGSQSWFSVDISELILSLCLSQFEFSVLLLSTKIIMPEKTMKIQYLIQNAWDQEVFFGFMIFFPDFAIFAYILP